jgi:calcineurin-like phosphoesterase family protein
MHARWQGNIWFTSDHHFDHNQVLGFSHRPFKVTKDMDEYMIKMWNERVRAGDLVYHLGDFAWSHAYEYIKRLSGHIILIRGNHDQSKRGTLCLPYVNNMRIRIGKYDCLLNHRPVYPASFLPNGDPYHDHDKQVAHRAKAERINYVLSGHIHNNYEKNKEGRKIGRLWTGISLNVGVDLHGLAPIDQARVIELFKERDETIKDQIIIKGK